MIQLFCDDCKNILPSLSGIDALITDPPYGVRFLCNSPAGRISKHAKSRHRNVAIVGDDEAFDPIHLLNYPTVILFGANNYADKLPASRGWIFWHKRPHMKPNDYGDGELIWTNKNKTVKYFEYLWNGMLRAGERKGNIPKYHPSQKPIALMEWLITNYTKPGDTVCDPYMGSGTTGIACARTGRNFIGIELVIKYYLVAKKRIEEELGESI